MLRNLGLFILFWVCKKGINIDKTNYFSYFHRVF